MNSSCHRRRRAGHRTIARHELRRIGDREGNPVEIPANSTQEALNHAATYLHERFGPLTNAPNARNVERSVRLINEPPLKDERHRR